MAYNIVATACTSGLFFQCAEMLIASIHKHSYGLINEIRVLDLGLSTDELAKLSNYVNVNVIKITDDMRGSYFDGYWYPRKFGYKVHIIHELSTTYDDVNIIWLDAGVCLINSLKEVIDIIENDNIIAVHSGFTVENMTTELCLTEMNATVEERTGWALEASIVGCKSNGKHQQLINDWYMYSKNEKCLLDGGDVKHRHDQSILSVLFNRYNIPLRDDSHFLYWYGGTDPSNIHYHVHPVYGMSYPSDCITIVHRGAFLHDYDDLIKYIVKKNKIRNIVITESDSKLFECTEMLIASLHKYSYNIVDEIHILDLGLSVEETTKLKTYCNVFIDTLDESIIDTFFDEKPETYDIRNFIVEHGVKSWYLYDTTQRYANHNIIMVNSEICFINSIQEILNIIDGSHFFITSAGSSNKPFITKECADILNCTEKELKGNMGQSEIVGVRSNGNHQSIVDDWYKFSRIRDCIMPGNKKMHRFEQSILSVLCVKQDIDFHPPRHYLYWYGGIDPTSVHYHVDSMYGVSYPKDCVSIVHRGTYMHEYNNIVKYIRKIQHD